MANSSQLVLPTITAPAASSRSTTARVVRRDVAARGCAIRPSCGIVRVQRLSLSATGTPKSGEMAVFRAPCIELGRALERALGVDMEERVDRAVGRGDSGQRGLAGLDG